MSGLVLILMAVVGFLVGTMPARHKMSQLSVFGEATVNLKSENCGVVICCVCFAKLSLLRAGKQNLERLIDTFGWSTEFWLR